MIKQIFVCDKCHGEWDISDENAEQPVSIDLRINFGYHCPASSISKSQVWCRACVMKAGVELPRTTEDKAVAPAVPPSTEDILIMLIEQLGFTRQG